MRVITEEEKLFLKSLHGKTVKIEIYYDNHLFELEKVVSTTKSHYSHFSVTWIYGRISNLPLESLDVFRETGVFQKFNEGWSVTKRIKGFGKIRTNLIKS